MPKSTPLFIAPMLLASSCLFLVPLALLGRYSLVGTNGNLSLAHYTAFLADPFNLHVLVATARLALETLVVTTVTGLPVALLYWHVGRRLRAVITFLSVMPMLTGNAVKTFAWVVILGRHGPLNQMLGAFGLAREPVRFLFSELGVGLAMCQINLPLIILPLIAAYSRADRRQTEAAEVAGAGPWRIFATILLPIGLPALLAGWTLVFASTTASFLTQAVIGGARHIYLPQLIYRDVGVLFDWPLAACISMVLLAGTAVLLALLTLVGRNRRLTTHV